jgi:VanZ family protein
MREPSTKTTAWPLALAYLVLVVYASLFPFEGWRNQGLSAFEFLSAALPRYWTGFDVFVNVLGYVPLGLLLALALALRLPTLWALSVAILVCSAVSLALEAAQTYLPGRVPSNLDWSLNTGGAGLGAIASHLLQRCGWLAAWQEWKRRWLVGEPRGALVLLALWPLALVFPAALPFGLGQIASWLDLPLAMLVDLMGLAWSHSNAAFDASAMSGATEWTCIVIGLLVPCLLAYSIMVAKWARAVMLLGIVCIGLVMMALSSTLSFGPIHAWVWLTPNVQLAIVCTLVAGVGLLWCPRKVCLVMVLVGLVFQLSVLNNTPINSYLGQNLLAWEQGRFARFHGLSQWLAAVWPYLLMLYTGLRLSQRVDP